MGEWCGGRQGVDNVLSHFSISTNMYLNAVGIVSYGFHVIVVRDQSYESQNIAVEVCSSSAVLSLKFRMVMFTVSCVMFNSICTLK